MELVWRARASTAEPPPVWYRGAVRARVLQGAVVEGTGIAIDVGRSLASADVRTREGVIEAARIPIGEGPGIEEWVPIEWHLHGRARGRMAPAHAGPGLRQTGHREHGTDQHGQDHLFHRSHSHLILCPAPIWSGSLKRDGKCVELRRGIAPQFLARWQAEMKRSAAIGIGRRPKPAAVGLDDRTADRQSHPHALRLGRIEGLEETLKAF
jgi:hypothetical protein